MIYDKIDNWKTYAGVSEGIREGLEYLAGMNGTEEIGVHVISPRAKAIVSEYTTKEINEKGYEAHKEFIDIQYLLSGEEVIACLPLEDLTETVPYNPDKDILFYKDQGTAPVKLPIGHSYFAILFPQDGHMPCLQSSGPCKVRKVVVKVKC